MAHHKACRSIQILLLMPSGYKILWKSRSSRNKTKCHNITRRKIKNTLRLDLVPFGSASPESQLIVNSNFSTFLLYFHPSLCFGSSSTTCFWFRVVDLLWFIQFCLALLSYGLCHGKLIKHFLTTKMAKNFCTFHE